MTNKKCKYHTNQDAISKCESCGALICLECKNIFRTHHYGSSYRRRHGTSFRRSYSTSYELCPECYANRVNKSKNPIGFIIVTVFVIIFMITASNMFSESESAGMSTPGGFQAMFIIIPLLMCGIMGYNYFIKSPQQRAEAERRRNTALDARSRSSSYKVKKSPYKTEKTYKSNHSSLYCQQCGQKLDKNAEFCSNCGDTTADERRNQRYDKL